MASGQHMRATGNYVQIPIEFHWNQITIGYFATLSNGVYQVYELSYNPTKSQKLDLSTYEEHYENHNKGFSTLRPYVNCSIIVQSLEEIKQQGLSTCSDLVYNPRLTQQFRASEKDNYVVD
ncbi:hypothetical protein MS3_00007776 [Schistosoma haematobium]|uniref:Uncharacterized protein n=1 Tax=Schistosoma haematobium TaxID=6185 RepID=A0A6A5D195_SCHHA|nr:hypothetical protein MS3_00007776 [Schistosoma haematobium]KAH9583349.1 hypothetical protein MS3_00007776 [Schistosoma haematobium]